MRIQMRQGLGLNGFVVSLSLWAGFILPLIVTAQTYRQGFQVHCIVGPEAFEVEGHCVSHGQVHSIHMARDQGGEDVIVDEWFGDGKQVFHLKTFVEKETGGSFYEAYGYKAGVYGTGEPIAELAAVLTAVNSSGVDEARIMEIMKNLSSFKVNRDLFAVRSVKRRDEGPGVVRFELRCDFVPHDVVLGRNFLFAVLKIDHSTPQTEVVLTVNKYQPQVDVLEPCEVYALSSTARTELDGALISAPHLPEEQSVTMIDGRFTEDLRYPIAHQIEDGQWPLKDDPHVQFVQTHYAQQPPPPVKISGIFPSWFHWVLAVLILASPLLLLPRRTRV